MKGFHRAQAIRRAGMVFVLAVASAVVLALPSTVVRAADAPALNLAYLPEDAVGAMVIHPKMVTSAPEMELLPVEVITAAGLEHAGFDPLDIEQALGFMFKVPLDGSVDEPPVGVVLHFSKAYEAKTVLGKLVPRGTHEVVQNAPCVFGASSREPSAAMPDDRTLIIASESYLRDMLDNPKSEGPLHKALLAEYQPTDCLFVLFSVELMRDEIMAALEKSPPPPPLGAFASLPELVQTVQLHVRLQPQFSGQLVLQGRDAESAKQVRELLKMTLAMGKQMALSSLANEMRNRDHDPVQEAAARYGQRLTKAMFDSVKFELSGDHVTISNEGNMQIATAGMMMALLLPAVQSGRERGRQMVSMSQMREIGTAMLMYDMKKGHYPPRAILDKDGKPLLSWRVALLPYLEQEALYKQFHLDEPWDSEHNKSLISKMPAIYANPSVPEPGKTTYLVPVGKGTVFGESQEISGGDVRDGTSTTILLVEADEDQAVIWTKPKDLDVDPKNPDAGLGTLRNGTFQAVFADGHTSVISLDISAETLWAIFTYAGHEAIDDRELYPHGR